ERVVIALELIEGLLLVSAHYVGDVLFGVAVADARLWATVGEMVADRLQQVSLAQAHPPVNEQRVVGDAGVLGDLDGGRPRELVRLTGDEAVEGKRPIEPPAFGRRGFCAGACGRGVRA